MPEFIILISAIVCVGSSIVLYYNRASAAATGVAVISFIVFLYGVGQFVDRDNPKKAEAPLVAQRPADVIPDEPAKQIQLPPPTQLHAVGAPGPTVIISDFATYKTSTNYVELSGKVVNNN